jgi:hypothetical protein
MVLITLDRAPLIGGIRPEDLNPKLYSLNPK